MAGQQKPSFLPGEMDHETRKLPDGAYVRSRARSQACRLGARVNGRSEIGHAARLPQGGGL